VLTDLARRYRWADEDLDLALAVAVVQGRGVGEVIRSYGGDPERPVGEFAFTTLADLQGDLDQPRHHVQAIVHKGAVVMLEWNGWTGLVPEIARRCSVGGRFFAVHWSLSGNPRVNHAVDGRVAANFEMFADAPAPPWRAAAVDVGALRSTALALMEQQTGVAFERGWLGDPRATYRVPDPDDLLRGVPGAWNP
jgi:hypothetical protein